MSAAVMSNASLKWEQVGGKKKSNPNKTPTSNGLQSAKPSSIPTLQNKAKAGTKMPTIETLPPLRVEKTIYDLLDREDSSGDEENTKVTSKANKSPTSSNGNVSNKKSPKQQQKQQNQNSLRLAAQPTTTHQPVKKLENDLDSVMSTLTLDDFRQEYANFLTLYPNAQATAFKHMATFLNTKLNLVTEVEPTFSNENDLKNPLLKFEKKIREFYEGLLNKLNKSECEGAFEYIIDEIIKDTKSVSTHGYKIIGQLLLKKFSDLPLKNLSKFDELLNTNRHRHTRCLIALWTIAQSGLGNLEAGLKIWFGFMVNHLNIKQYTSLIVNCLNHLLEHHKTKQNLKENEYLSIRQYLDFHDLLDDKTSIISSNKDLNQKLQNSYKNLRELLYKQSKANYSDYFETILTNLPLAPSNKQNEVLECAKLCLLHGKDTYTKWRQIYLKYLKQTHILLKHILNSYADYKHTNSIDLKQTLKYFEQNSTFYLKNSLQSTTTTTNKTKSTNQQQNLIKKSPKQQQLSTNDLELMQNINSLVKELVKEHISVKFSIMSRLFKLFIFILLSTGLFFYWDVNVNGSIYTKQVAKQLENYGLLDITLKIIDYVKDLLTRTKNFLAVYIPPIYQKARKTVVYYSSIAWDYTKEYSIYAWKISEPYRTTAYNYSIQAINYIQKQLPTLTDNLVSLFYLFLNYLSTLYSFLMHYFNLLISFIETKLFGWREGELAIVFTDGLKQIFKYLSDFFKWLNESAF